MFTVNSKIVVIREDVPFTEKGEQLTIKGQSNTHLLVEDDEGDRFKVEKALFGTHFMVSFHYSPDTEDDMDPDGQTYTLDLERKYV